MTSKIARVLLWPALMLALSSPVVAHLCGTTWTPAFSVPPTVNGVTMWTDTFGPATQGQVPEERDSTSYTGFGVPSAANGTEIWNGLKIVDDVMFTNYNYGIQAWDIGGANAPDPIRVAYRDGFAGHWANGVGGGEDKFFVKDMDAVRWDGNEVILASSALAQVGTTIWRYKETSDSFEQIYQERGRVSGRQVEIANVGSDLWAFVGSTNGVWAYDIGRARTQRCDESSCTFCEEGVNCPSGIAFTNRMGNLSEARYVSALQVGASTYVMGADGAGGSESTLWRLDPGDSPEDAVPLYTTTQTIHGPELFEKDGFVYLAYVGEGTTVEVHYLTNQCLNASAGGCNLGSPVATDQANDKGSTGLYLQYSEASGGAPYLYLGFNNGVLHYGGGQGEYIYDLADLSPTGTLNLTGITEAPEFGSYTDVCGHTPIGYWAHTYSGNEFGYTWVAGLEGMFSGDYFYRVAASLIDVHALDPGNPPPPEEPEISLSIDDPPSSPYYLDEAIEFRASNDNTTACPVSPGPGWVWTEDGEILPDPSPDSIARYWPLENGASESVQVEAFNCPQSNGGPTVASVGLTLADPRPVLSNIFVDGVPGGGGTFTQCDSPTLEAGFTGREAALEWFWRAVNKDCAELPASVVNPEDCQLDLGETVGGDPVARQQKPQWAAEDLGGALVFMDGFESGSDSAWGTNPDVQFNVELRTRAKYLVENVPDTSICAVDDPDCDCGPDPFCDDAGPVELTFETAGSPVIQTLQVSDGDGDDSWDLVVSGNASALEYRWEIEDPRWGPGDVGTDPVGPVDLVVQCSFPGATADDRCSIFDWEDRDTSEARTYTWFDPDAPGGSAIDVHIKVEARSCDSATASKDFGPFSVSQIAGGTPPEVLGFYIVDDDCSISGGDYICPTATAIDFWVCTEARDPGQRPDGFEVEWALPIDPAVDSDVQGTYLGDDCGTGLDTWEITNSYSGGLAGETLRPRVSANLFGGTSAPEDLFTDLILQAP